MPDSPQLAPGYMQEQQWMSELFSLSLRLSSAIHKRRETYLETADSNGLLQQLTAVSPCSPFLYFSPVFILELRLK